MHSCLLVCLRFQGGIMARIRTIKPEFWDSPATARASLRARLFFIAMWNWADDFGRGTANPKQLIAFAFPNDEIGTKEFPSLAKEVADCFGVVFYEVEGRPFYAIPSWDKHQRTERKAKGLYPPPPDNIIPGQEVGEGASDDSEGTSDATQGSSGPGTGEQGNRGTGEQNTLAHRNAASDFDNFWSAYPRKVGKQKARTKFAAATRRAAPAVIIAGAQRLAHDPNLPELQFIPHPTTWLERDGWEDEPLPPRLPQGRTFDQMRDDSNRALWQRIKNEDEGGPSWELEA